MRATAIKLAAEGYSKPWAIRRWIELPIVTNRT